MNNLFSITQRAKICEYIYLDSLLTDILNTSTTSRLFWHFSFSRSSLLVWTSELSMPTTIAFLLSFVVSVVVLWSGLILSIKWFFFFFKILLFFAIVLQSAVCITLTAFFCCIFCILVDSSDLWVLDPCSNICRWNKFSRAICQRRLIKIMDFNRIIIILMVF